jgi:hypothetical protein
MNITLGSGLTGSKSREILTEILSTIGKDLFGEEIFDEVDLKIQFGFPSWINRSTVISNSSLVHDKVMGMVDFYYSYSFMSPEGKLRNFLIYIDFEEKFNTNMEMVVTLLHEVYHCMQFATGISKITKKGYEYKGKEYPNDTLYEDAPWETDAYAYELTIPKIILSNQKLVDRINEIAV